MMDCNTVFSLHEAIVKIYFYLFPSLSHSPSLSISFSLSLSVSGPDSLPSLLCLPVNSISLSTVCLIFFLSLYSYLHTHLFPPSTFLSLHHITTYAVSPPSLSPPPPPSLCLINSSASLCCWCCGVLAG